MALILFHTNQKIILQHHICKTKLIHSVQINIIFINMIKVCYIPINTKIGTNQPMSSTSPTMYFGECKQHQTLPQMRLGAIPTSTLYNFDKNMKRCNRRPFRKSMIWLLIFQLKIVKPYSVYILPLFSWLVGCGLTSHSAIFQLYSDGTVVQFPNLDLLPSEGPHA